MIAACALLAGAVAAGWLVPYVLARVDLRRRDPLPLIVAWLVSMAGVLVAAASGVLLLLLPGHGPGPALLTAMHRCWSAIQHGSPPRVEESRRVRRVGPAGRDRRPVDGRVRARRAQAGP